MKRTFCTLVGIVFATLAYAADDALPRTARDAAEIDRELDAAIARYRLPGIAVGIVEDGEVVYARTAGVRVAGEEGPVTRRTLFKVASNTKSMTTAALARLVAAGRLAWDDPVVKHVPEFRMHDPWVTREMQVRDLLIHNSGLRAGAGDLMLWPEPNHYTRADILRGLPHLVPIYSFRSRYAYDNLLYIVAGEVAAAAGGVPYEALVAREVFEPLGMQRCRVGEWRPGPDDEVAQPHRLDGERNVPIRRDGEVVRATTMDAAGGVRCSLDDMLAWIRAWVAPDERARRWLGPAQREALWSAHTPMPIGARARAWNRTRFYAYGYGWRLQDIDGEYSVSHTGTLAGMYSLVHLLPERRSGFVLMINGSGDEARTVLNQVLVKRYTDPGGTHTVARYADAIAAERAAPGASRAPDTSQRTPVAPAALGPVLGTWHDPWLGEATLCPDGDTVRFAVRKSPALSGVVMRVGTRHLVDWDDETVGVEAWLDPVPASGDAKPATLRMAKVDPDADFSSDFEDLAFTRLRGCDSSARTAAEAGLVDIATLAPSIELEIRYAGPDNFVGAPVDGYEAERCLLLEPAARALARIARRVARDGLSLRVYDCYRPVRAVRHFVRWAQDLDDTRTKRAYYPNLDKSALMPEYISPSSGHSRGATVDLTLVRCDGARCTPLDMGTPWDFFDPRAHHGAAGITPAQARNRERLRAAMAAEGFVDYPAEWWHYRYEPEPGPDTAFDVPVR